MILRRHFLKVESVRHTDVGSWLGPAAISGRRMAALLSDNFWVLFLLVLGVALRLIWISQPYIDAWSWKQGTIAMIAENFYRNGFDILYPQINWGGNAAGYIGTEFPLVPFIAALLYIPFGIHEWIGRSISLAFFAASVPMFYRLVQAVSDKDAAVFATAIYVFAPLSIFAGRSFQSDMASLSCAIAALYCFHHWLKRPDNNVLWLTAGGAATLAILVKLPAIIIGVPLLYAAWDRYGVRLWRQPKLWAFAVVSLLLPMAWYWHAYVVSLSNPPYHFTGERGLQIEDLRWYLSIAHGVFFAGLTPIVSVAMIAGLSLRSGREHQWIFHWWLVAIVCFVVIAGYGNRHPWYQLPIVPVAAALSGRVLAFALRGLRACSRLRIIPLLACMALFIGLAASSYWYLRPLYDPFAKPLWEAGKAITRLASGDALIIFADDGDSSALYYSHRKGWHAFLDDSQSGNPLNSQQAIAGLEELRKQGATHLVFTQYTMWWLDYYGEFAKYLDLRYARATETEEYVIFDLTGRTAMSTQARNANTN